MDVVADAFRGVRGFRVDAYSGWGGRGSTLFNPSHVMDHHTGAGSYNALLRYMAEGPVHPPLCNIATSRPSSGIVRITIVAAGRANHAGKGSFRTIPLNQGNRYAIGIENQNDGGQSWPSQQIEAMRRLDAALLSHMGRDVGYLLDHKTYAPSRKSDRHTIIVADERREVQRLMSAPVDPWSKFMSELSNAEQARLKKVAGLSDAHLDNVIQYAETIGPPKLEMLSEGLDRAVSWDTTLDSIFNQFMQFHRNERPRIAEILTAIEEMDSSTKGTFSYVIATIRVLRAIGVPLTPEVLEAVSENKAYTREEIEQAAGVSLPDLT